MMVQISVMERIEEEEFGEYYVLRLYRVLEGGEVQMSPVVAFRLRSDEDPVKAGALAALEAHERLRRASPLDYENLTVELVEHAKKLAMGVN